jgi:pyruvate dehydrogenase E2 component (dihydrolipoamide acetyltransferase)
MSELFALERGSGALPVVLLHGFGGSYAAWNGVVSRIGEARRTIAFDLPGHSRSLGCAHGSAAVAARAVLAALADRNVRSAHFVGHSFGGTAAALTGLMEPRRVASLTLLSPGGFGREINHRLLRRYAAARDAPEIAVLLEQFFGWDKGPPATLAAEQSCERQAPGAVEALKRIVETFFEGSRQKVLPVAELASLDVPAKVIWGTQDRVLPARQAHKLPGRLAVHIFEGVGHMLPYEIPDDAAHLILENTR